MRDGTQRFLATSAFGAVHRTALLCGTKMAGLVQPQPGLMAGGGCVIGDGDHGDGIAS